MNNEKIKNLVKKLVSENQTVCPFTLARSCNFNLLFYDLGKENYGFPTLFNRTSTIVINRNLNGETQRFVYAHELGHCSLHNSCNIVPFTINHCLNHNIPKIKKEANLFAMTLLFQNLDKDDFQYYTTQQLLQKAGILSKLDRLTICENIERYFL